MIWKRPAPQPGSRRHDLHTDIGLELRPDELTFTAGRADHATVQSVTVPLSTAVDWAVPDVDAVDVLQVCSDYAPELQQMGNGQVHCLLPTAAVTLKSFTLPAADRRELRAIVEQELADAPGIDPDDLTFDFSCTPGPQSDTVEVDVTATSQTLVTGLARGLHRLGLTCVRMESRVSALSRLCPPESGTAGLLDWDTSGVTCALFAENRRRYVRQFRRLEPQHLATQLSQRWQLSQTRTGALIDYFDRASSPIPAALRPLHREWEQTWTETAEELLSEVGRTVEFARFQQGLAAVNWWGVTGAATAWNAVATLFPALEEIAVGTGSAPESVRIACGTKSLFAAAMMEPEVCHAG